MVQRYETIAASRTTTVQWIAAFQIIRMPPGQKLKPMQLVRLPALKCEGGSQSNPQMTS
jgi:hypothetical protein